MTTRSLILCHLEDNPLTTELALSQYINSLQSPLQNRLAGNFCETVWLDGTVGQELGNDLRLQLVLEFLVLKDIS